MNTKSPITGVLALVFAIASGFSLPDLKAATVAMNDPAFLYSPFNWGVTAQSAKTINSGAYFKVLFSGTSCALTTDTSGDAAPFSEFWARIDGGPFSRYTLAAGNPVFAVGASLPNRKHILEVVIKSTSETIDRWSTQKTAVVFTGLTLDAGAIVAAPVRKPFNILIYGDSITEGVLVNGSQGFANDTDRNDAVQDYSWLLAQEVPAEVGVVAFGYTGIIHLGNGNVPALGASYDHLWAGQLRSFTSPPPDLILYNEGTNDGSSITAGMTAIAAALRTAAPDARQLLLLPFNGSHAADLKAAVAAMASTKVTFGDTTGFFSSADSPDGLHPYGYTHIASIAPQMARLVTPLLQLPPSGVAGAESNGAVVLNWAPATNATAYNIKRATNSGGPYTSIGSSSAPTYTDGSGANGTTYYYVLSALYGGVEGVNSAEVAATVFISFNTFQHSYFTATQLLDPTVSGVLADPNQSGVNNLLAYAFNVTPWTATAANLPSVQKTGGLLALSFTRRKPPTDVTYAVEVSTDLLFWNSGPGFTTELNVVPLDANTDRVTVGNNNPPSANNPAGFMRLSVSY